MIYRKTDFAAAIQRARLAGLEEAVTVVNGLIGKDSGNWNRAIVYAVDAIRQRAKEQP